MIAVPLKYGPRVIGVVVISKLGIGQFDEDDVRLLEVLARPRLRRARERAPLRGAAQRGRAREGIARDRERAPRLQPRARLRGRARGGARPSRGAERQDPRRRTRPRCGSRIPTDLDAARALGYEGESEERDQAAALPARGRTALPRPGRSVRARARRGGDDRGRAALGDASSLSLRSISTAGAGCIVGIGGPGPSLPGERRMRLLAGMAHQAKLAIGNAGATSASRRRSSPPSRRSRTPSRRTTSTPPPRALDHGHGAAGRRGARPRREDAEAPRARGALPRHRQDRDPLVDPLEARAAHPRGARGDRDASRARRADPRPDLAPRGRPADRAPLPRALDGKGYPDGKAGDDIPIEARVILVCDAFHAMTTDRPYRAAPARGRLRAARGEPARSSTPRSSPRSSSSRRRVSKPTNRSPE